MDTLSAAQIADADLPDWRHAGNAVVARFETGDFARGLALVAAVGARAEAANHHPDVLLTYPSVTIRLSSHDAGGVTDRDIALAREISEIAEAQSIRAAASESLADDAGTLDSD